MTCAYLGDQCGLEWASYYTVQHTPSGALLPSEKPSGKLGMQDAVLLYSDGHSRPSTETQANGRRFHER